ncbi:uncharacterized protein LOC121418258 [Lytechinus variegatus]|uniref:uncharacterized protein LOC121418258 n=1 Tax=Lytechinus variegatus TaxID=7654 RepID=UPI001BB28699|nr:uncharacterized protein LOC121418258 [Lytechinus variegatus]
MSSMKRKQNNPTKSASDHKKKERVSRPSRITVKSEPDEASLARTRPQRKIIPKRPLSPDVELSSRRKKRKKKKAPPAKPVNVMSTHAVHIQPDEIKQPKLSKAHKASLKPKKKKRKKKTFVFPILASDRVPRDQETKPSKSKDGEAGLSISSPRPAPTKKRSKHIARNVLDVDLLRMLPAAELVKKFSKHTSFKVPTEESKTQVKQHVYSCKMLPHYCTEKFYGNDEDTKRQITKHLLRHVGELLTVTNRGINMMAPSAKKHKKKESKKGAENPANSTMYILPSAPRPMRVTLPKNVSSRMKRSSYTVIRSADGSEKGISEVVLLPKGRLLGIMNAPTKQENNSDLIDVDDSSYGGDPKERVVVKKGRGVLEGTASKVDLSSPLDSKIKGLSIESLAKAVEAMVDKESQGLNIEAAEALVKAASGDGKDNVNAEPDPVRVVKKEPTSPTPSSSSSSSSSSGFSSSSTSASPSPIRITKDMVRVKEIPKLKLCKVSKKTKKKPNPKAITMPDLIPTAVNAPSADHNYAFTNNLNHGAPVHLDSEGRPIDSPPGLVDEWENDAMDIDPLVTTMNDQLYKLITDIDPPSPDPKVSDENEEPVIVEGANVTVANEEVMADKPKKSKIKSKIKVNIQSEEVKQSALNHLQSFSKIRKRKGPFTCEICNKVLTAASTLRAHYRSHAGIKPYQCDICQATFTRLHSLKYHTMIHNKEARFLCSYCQRQFRHSSHYREHLRRHTGEEPFGCSDCSARFKTRNTYKRHLRSKHGKVVSEDGKINLAPPDIKSKSAPPDIKSNSGQVQIKFFARSRSTEGSPSKEETPSTDVSPALELVLSSGQSPQMELKYRQNQYQPKK